MSLYVRHNAWLNTAPDKAEGDKSKAPPVSRLASLRKIEKDDDFTPEMPDPGAAAYLLGHFWAVGPTVGDSQITQGELRHYQDNEGITLSPWECATMRRLSIEHMNESQRATKRDCKAPWQSDEYLAVDKVAAARRLEESMRELTEM